MNWEEKLEALQSLGDAQIKMLSIGRWFVCIPDVEIRSPQGMLTSTFGEGADPESAVSALWDEFTNLASGKYLVVEAMRGKRRAVKWSGFMWKDITETST